MSERVYSAIIIGAGFGGLGMAIQFRRSGERDFIVLEKSLDLGGTWLDNTYPGAACDVPSSLYSYSFEQDFDWSRRYSRQPDIHRYQHHCAQKYDIERHMVYGREVTLAAFDEAAGVWRVSCADGECFQARALITSTGHLNRPMIPEISGREGFDGEQFHSARWNHEHELTGKRVAVIGTGASATQFLAHVAKKAAEVHVFQRTPNYVLPKPDFKIGKIQHWLNRRVPGLRNLMRGSVYGLFESLGSLFMKFQPGLVPFKMAWSWHLKRSINDPDTREALRPDYQLGCKRVLFDNTFYPALNRDNVHLHTGGVLSIGGDFVENANGECHSVDTIIYGTGFRANELLSPIDIRGHGGRKLADDWSEGASAYLGISTYGYPNLFMLYGPNTSVGHNSIIYMLESQFTYVLQAMKQLTLEPGLSLGVKLSRQRRFEAEVQGAFNGTVWTSGCNSWYLGANGYIPTLWSGLTFSYRRITRHFDRGAYIDAPTVIPRTPLREVLFAAINRYTLKPVLSAQVGVGVQRAYIGAITKLITRARKTTFQSIMLGGVPCERVSAKGQKIDDSMVTLYIHGGAFVIGSPGSHRNITARLAHASAMSVYSVAYRLAPEHRAPAALDDVFNAYGALLEQGYRGDQICVVGDSAGGNLALALCLRLHQQGIAQPRAMALISPWVDLLCEQQGEVSDALLDLQWMQWAARVYTDEKDLAQPLFSPINADLSVLPPTVIHAAEHERLSQDALRLNRAMLDAGVHCELQIYPGLWHDFQLLAGWLPQASDSLQRIADFIVDPELLAGVAR